MAALIKKTVHTGITVSDLGSWTTLFRDVLGFEVTEPRRLNGTFIENVVGLPGADIEISFVQLPDHEIELLHYLGPKDRRRSELRPCDTGFLHLAFEVDDIDDVLDAIADNGFEPVRSVQDIEAGPRKGGRVVYTRHPDGVFFEFWQLPKE